MIRRMTIAMLLCLHPLPAHAQGATSVLREFCPDRPGLGTPACTLDPGHLVMELGGVDWTREQDGETRTDTIVGGDLLMRYGIARHLEVQAGWTGFGEVRERDRATGDVSRTHGVGDVSLALRRNLVHPDGSDLAAAAMAFATLPTGGGTIGAGDWSAGVLAPVSYTLADGIAFALTPQVSAEVDEDRHGRHLAYGSVAGIGIILSDTLGTAIEVQATRDRDPDGHMTQALASLSFGWHPRDGLQFDIGTVAGLNHASPDIQAYAGVARRF